MGAGAYRKSAPLRYSTNRQVHMSHVIKLVRPRTLMLKSAALSEARLGRRLSNHSSRYRRNRRGIQMQAEFAASPKNILGGLRPFLLDEVS